MVSLSIERLLLGKGCVVVVMVLFQEHFLYRNDARPRFPVSVGIQVSRGEGTGTSQGSLVWCCSPRPEKIKAMPNVWQL